MEDYSSQDSSELGKDIEAVAKAVGSLLRNRFPNVRRALSRLTGDVSDTALDALAERLQRYRIHQQVEAIGEIAAKTGLPPPFVMKTFAEQQRIDGLLAAALAKITLDGGFNTDESKPADATTAPDWFDVYRREATDRGEGELREAFVRILAGEIQEPGTFSVRTVRVLGMLDQETATQFRRAVSVSVRAEIKSLGGTPDFVQDARIPEMGKALGQNGLADFGLSYSVLTQLTASELLHPDYGSWYNYGPLGIPKISDSNFQVPLTHQDRQWYLIPNSVDKNGKPIRVTGAMFTKVGRELLKIVDIEQTPEFTKRLRAHFAKQGYTMAEYTEG